MSAFELEHLSVEVSGNWKSLARRLGFLEVDIEVFDMDNERFREKVFSMLMAWKRRVGSGATYWVLYEALCHPLVQRRDLAQMFCIYKRPFLVST